MQAVTNNYIFILIDGVMMDSSENELRKSLMDEVMTHSSSYHMDNVLCK